MDGKEMSLAWKLFKKEHQSLFENAPTGRYLENRLESAFLAGIVAAQAAARLQSGPRWRHKKRGTLYTEIADGLLQTEIALPDKEPMVVYRGDDGKTWVRPASEFYDGRFEPLANTPPEEHDA